MPRECAVICDWKVMNSMYGRRGVTRQYIAASPAHALTREARAMKNFTFQ
jgi:hypothetical protein